MSDDNNTISAVFHFPGAQPEYDVEKLIETYQRQAELTPDQIMHVRERRMVSAEERQHAEQAKTRFMQDRERVKRWHAGDADAKKEMMAINITLGSRVRTSP
jgi:alpha-D-ribose 1-methylphosphonate 5-triphosphate diphosphatase PhnM